MSEQKSIRGPYATYDATAGQDALNTGGIFRVRDILPDIPFKRPYSSLFYKFLTAVPHGRSAFQDKVEYGEQEKVLNYLTVNASTGSGDTSVTVTNAYNAVPGDKLYNPRTKEMIRIDAVDSATVISTAATTGYGRGFAGSTAATMRIGDRLQKMGNAMTEFGRTPETIAKMPTSDYNFCSFYIKAIKVGKLQENTKMLGNFGKMTEQAANAMFQFHEEINADLWWGRRALMSVPAASAHDSGGGNLYQMNGFDEQVHTNVWDLSDVSHVTWELWNEILSPIFVNNPGKRIMNCGQNVAASLTQCARGNVVPITYPSVIEGVDVTEIAVDGGTVAVVHDYDGLPPGSARVWDPMYVEYLPRDGYEEQWIRDTKLPTQVNEEVDTLLAGGTLVVRNDECHAKIDNLSGPFNARGIKTT